MDIIYYGSHYWDRGPWFRKQYFAKNLTDRGHRVFYIENSVSMMKWNSGDKNRLLKTICQKHSDNLYIITPSAFFPFPNSFLSRYLFNYKLLYALKKYIKEYSIKQYIIWFNITYFSTVIKHLKPHKVVFDLSDDLPLFFKLSNNHYAYRAQSHFLKVSYQYADISITTALRIKEKYQSLTEKEIIVIPNGHNFTSFKLEEKENLGELANVKPPIIGFIGTLFRFTDDSLLEFLISSRPQYSFVFIGKTESNFPIGKIKKYKNAFILGEKNKDMVGSYIKSFNICINPFKVHEVNDSVSPLKVFEYLAFRKHVISTSMYSLQNEPIAKYIKFARSYDEFLNLLDQIVISCDYENKIPEEELLAYNWNSLFIKLAVKLKNEYGLNL